MAETRIEWTDAVWNPVTGCTKVSSGCKHCYAEGMAKRFWGGEREFTDVRCHPERLEQPLRWRKPRRVFVNSMSDLFHDDVPFDFIACVFWTVAASPQHTYQVLTKRPARMLEFFRREAQQYGAPWPINNIMLGVSVEDQKTADERIPILLQAPAALRFVSVEPMLGPVDLRRLDPWDDFHTDALDTPDPSCKIGWVICGCESGPRARPMRPDWARSLRDQCAEAGVPFFLKQMEIAGKIVKMPELDGHTWDQFPEMGSQ